MRSPTTEESNIFNDPFLVECMDKIKTDELEYNFDHASTPPPEFLDQGLDSDEDKMLSLSLGLNLDLNRPQEASGNFQDPSSGIDHGDTFGLHSSGQLSLPSLPAVQEFPSIEYSLPSSGPPVMNRQTNPVQRSNLFMDSMRVDEHNQSSNFSTIDYSPISNHSDILEPSTHMNMPTNPMERNNLFMDSLGRDEHNLPICPTIDYNSLPNSRKSTSTESSGYGSLFPSVFSPPHSASQSPSYTNFEAGNSLGYSSIEDSPSSPSLSPSSDVQIRSRKPLSNLTEGEKYCRMREQNNVASRLYREKKKSKNNLVKEQFQELLAKNQHLKECTKKLECQYEQCLRFHKLLESYGYNINLS